MEKCNACIYAKFSLYILGICKCNILHFLVLFYRAKTYRVILGHYMYFPAERKKNSFSVKVSLKETIGATLKTQYAPREVNAA